MHLEQFAVKPLHWNLVFEISATSLPPMSKLPFELLLALRYLRPKRTFVSIITVISVLGVTLGVAVLIIVISVMTGFGEELKAKVLGFNAHLRIFDADQNPLENHAVLAKKISSHPHVTGVTPFVVTKVMMITQPVDGKAQVAAPYLRGVDAQSESSVSKLPQSVKQGKFDLEERGMVIGEALAQLYGLHVGDHVSIYSPADLQKMEESHRMHQEIVVSPKEFEVRGIFDVGHYEFNSEYVIVSIENAQELCNFFETDTVHGLFAKTDDPFRATQVARELEASLEGKVRVNTWLEDSELMMAVVVEKNVMLYILFFIVLVAAFGITCTLITFVMMKTRDIGVMKALGATRGQVMSIFLGQSLIVSVLGILGGLAAGLALIAYRNPFLGLMRKWTGYELFPHKIYGFSELPAMVVPGDVLIICGGSLVICLLAAALPAWHASKLNPVEALRHE